MQYMIIYSPQSMQYYLLSAVHAVLIIIIIIINYHQSIMSADPTLLSTMGDYSSCAMCLQGVMPIVCIEPAWGGHHLPRQPPVLL